MFFTIHFTGQWIQLIGHSPTPESNATSQQRRIWSDTTFQSCLAVICSSSYQRIATIQVQAIYVQDRIYTSYFCVKPGCFKRVNLKLQFLQKNLNVFTYLISDRKLSYPSKKKGNINITKVDKSILHLYFNLKLLFKWTIIWPWKGLYIVVVCLEKYSFDWFILIEVYTLNVFLSFQ